MTSTIHDFIGTFLLHTKVIVTLHTRNTLTVFTYGKYKKNFNF